MFKSEIANCIVSISLHVFILIFTYNTMYSKPELWFNILFPLLITANITSELIKIYKIKKQNKIREN
ncbi:hypothetical protein BAVI_04124 [Neobacillus vireti LMG 21834]|uniref:Uncharacterized protein n=1 Tax=Neobacillus vireti LMG 21834 TaxID=1131730 RepID=A0AB94ISS8_9BACI|nr:hypothetical protein BAVI_04124 [Neobacillus vireti LMG 21834]KLT15105.1 hypothetical protein AA980_24830 [Neobacillus vireti]